MPTKLDITKSYGTVHGSYDNRRYVQGEKFFDDQMDEIVPPDLTALLVPGAPRERTKAEKAQYEKDVADAAAVLAANSAGAPAGKS